MQDLELIVPLALIGIAVVLFVLWKMGIPPAKILPYVAGALAAVLGEALWQRSRNKGVDEKIKAKEEELKQDEEAVKRAGVKAAASEAELDAKKRETDAELAEYVKKRAENDAALEKRIEELRNSSGDESSRNLKKALAKD